MKERGRELRNKIESLLRKGYPNEFSIGEIATEVRTDRVTTVKYLKILQDEGVVLMTRAQGNYRYYRAKSAEKRQEVNTSQKFLHLAKYSFDDFPHPL